MHMVGTLVLLSALAGGGNTELLYFTMDGCGPCESMKPTLQRLEAQGFPITRINVTQNQTWARQYNVTQVPHFVLVSNGHVVDRHLGATSYARLVGMFERTGGGQQIAQSGHERRDAMQPIPASNSAVRTTGAQPTSQATISLASRRSTVPSHGSPVAKPEVGSQATGGAGMAGGQLSPQARAMQATVRIKVEDATGNSYATGTVIHAHGAEALVLTCGHVFRESQGKGRVSIDFGFPNNITTVPGKVLTYDAGKRDVGFVVFSPGVQIASAPLAPGGYVPKQGDQVFSIGCDHGQNPSLRTSTMKALTNYSGVIKYDVHGRPVDGRSGGGLFTAGGQLIAVCNAATVTVDEGIYAGLEPIYAQLADANLISLFNQPTHLQSQNAPPVQQQPQQAPIDVVSQTDQGQATGQVAAVASNLPGPSQSNVQAANQATSADMSLVSNERNRIVGGQEMIVLIRSEQHPSGYETMVLNEVSPALVQQIRQSHQSVPVSNEFAGNSPMPQGNTSWQSVPPLADAGTLRAQSPR